MTKLRALFLATALVPLAACGADDVASPGEGRDIVPRRRPPTPDADSDAHAGHARRVCPTGTTDGGVVGTRRACQVPSRFTADTTLQNIPGVAYSLVGPVNVGTDCGGDTAAPLAGCQAVTLTIQAGTVLFGSVRQRLSRRQPRLAPPGDRLRREPDHLHRPRQCRRHRLTASSQGLWGGVILLGRAPISDCNTAVPGGSAGCQQVIEGTTGSLYGGASPNDNSGTLQFVQIRYSGFQIAPGNELQGLTMGGVGQLTTVNNIQIHNSSDDGIEIFGGRVNTRFLVITGADDDGLDTDLGVRGTHQFVIAVQKPTGDGELGARGRFERQ